MFVGLRAVKASAERIDAGRRARSGPLEVVAQLDRCGCLVLLAIHGFSVTRADLVNRSIDLESERYAVTTCSH